MRDAATQSNWRRLLSDARQRDTGVAADPRTRCRWLLGLFAACLLLIFGRLASLEMTYGEQYRQVAARPAEHAHWTIAPRGRILTRDGTVLACDEPVAALSLSYRWLEEPSDRAWLRAQARARLNRADRRNIQRIAIAEDAVRRERDELHARLATLCGLTITDWRERCHRVQSRVERAAVSVNNRQAQKVAAHERQRLSERETQAEDIWYEAAWHRLEDALVTPDLATGQITIREQIIEHRVVEGLSLEAIARVQSQPELFPGVVIEQRWRRAYPSGPLAAHVLGYVGPPTPSEKRVAEAGDVSAADEDRLLSTATGALALRAPGPEVVGRAGLESTYDTLLRGEPGLEIEERDQRGNLIGTKRVRNARAGRDLIVSLDPALQRQASALLEAALARNVSTLENSEHTADDNKTAGAAAVVMDVQSGAVLAMASAPNFDPRAFVIHDDALVRDYLSSPTAPLLNRAAQMALPPGSVFKTVTAVALMQDGRLDPTAPFACQGYLHTPAAQRCAIFRHTGHGHGEVALRDALAQSCNVYFYHHAGEMGPEPLALWAARLGFGARSGIDLPSESAGQLPQLAQLKTAGRWRTADTEAMAIGQSSLATTPLQVARMMAAVANGGQLVTPHLAWSVGLTTTDPVEDAAKPVGDDNDPARLIKIAPPRPIEGLRTVALSAVRRGLEDAVSDEQGTAHEALSIEGVPVATKTGTAETGPGKKDHAWIAGYAPADKPRIVFVVVVEHAGSGGAVAGPVARHLVLQMKNEGYFQPRARLESTPLVGRERY